KSYGVEDLSDAEVRSFPFMQSVFSHVSRMYFVLSEKGFDTGLDGGQIEVMTDAWIKYLMSFYDSAAMKRMILSALSKEDFNSSFLSRVRLEVAKQGGFPDVISAKYHDDAS